jgi:two-component system alkaline phosphatase synthesis response regulator PhoP
MVFSVHTSVMRRTGVERIVLVGNEADLEGRVSAAQLGVDLNVHAPGERIDRLLQSIRYDRPKLVVLGDSIRPAAVEALCRVLKDDVALKDVPVVVLGGSSDAARDEVAALSAGADDYVPRRATPEAVAARLQALLRRTQSSSERQYEAEEPVLRIGNIAVYPERYVAEANGRALQLTVAEFRLLVRLIRGAGRVRTAEQLADPSYRSDESGDPERSVRSRMSSLRSKLGPAGIQIKTIRNAGYQITD